MDIIKSGTAKGNIPNALGTAAGDTIYFSAPGVPAVLAKATDGQVLTLASGLPSWANAGGGEDYGYLRNVALQNALDILEMQAADTLDSGQTANLIRDIFSDANGYLNTIDTDETDAEFLNALYNNNIVVTTEVQPAGDVDKDWRGGCAVSGSTMIAGVYAGRLYVSTNSGTNWNEVQPAGDVDKNWRGAAVSGTTIVAVALSGRVYMSTNSGTNWNEVQPAGDVDKGWWFCSVSGTTIIIGGGRLYVSTNSGTNWNEVQPAGDVDKDWRSGSISGSTMIAGAYGSRLYVSTNSGSSWTEVQPAGDVDKTWHRCSAGGSTMIAGVYGGRLYVVNFEGANKLLQTSETLLDYAPTHFQFFAWKKEYTSTGNITIDVSFDGGDNYQTGIALDTPTEITNTGTEMMLKINLNKGASDGTAQLAGYGIMLWGEA